ncbi:PRD domain-containing protein [Lentibacillus amyloliquefaciens]|uniref:PRD domain-containing protein n=1 Tax=Lentibacillus amyloliquefaciens TaxID=1472767 RepID=A0A0U3W3S4_9BACI|nr:PRD domain-containing protein [Lentibacillus amyloliquefaciens]ALX47824.1 hypothetical protein AOX59_03940 [Lentibacillus amyloliquefaciens]
MELQELENRLNILLEQEVIDEHAYAVTIDAYKEVINLLNIERLEQGEMLFTHLPMALTRIGNGEEVEGPDSGMMQEVKNSSNYPKAKSLLGFVERNWVKSLPQEEKDFLKLHFTNVLNINEGVK